MSLGGLWVGRPGDTPQAQATCGGPSQEGGRWPEPGALAQSRGRRKGRQAVGKLHTTRESAALQKAKRTAGKVLSQKRALSVCLLQKTFTLSQAPD